ncbi:MAG: DUF2807 domain-containing protein [Candidatus Azobacteroides sp.]|nr:DUF2807 domain-containing protein [Candidatus Azobacteroides sp.]
MKRVFLFLMITGLTTMVAFGQKTETRSVSGFTGIDASSAFDITVTKGGTESLSIEADDEIMPYVRSEVKNGVLNLYLDNRDNFNRNMKNIKILKASIVMKNLDKVALSGACKLTADDLFTPDKFKSDCSGASKMSINVNTGQLSIEASGASKIQIKANVSGNTELEVSGASKIQGELKATHVKFDSSGTSSIELTGSAENIDIDTSGTASVMAEDFAVKNANIESSGVSKVTVNVSDALKVNSSGVSSVSYKGSPVINASNGKMAKIKKI